MPKVVMSSAGALNFAFALHIAFLPFLQAYFYCSRDSTTQMPAASANQKAAAPLRAAAEPILIAP